MSEQTEMNLEIDDDPTTPEQLEQEKMLQEKKAELVGEFNKMLERIVELGFDAIIVANNKELDLTGAWGTSDNEITNLGLAAIVKRKFV